MKVFRNVDELIEHLLWLGTLPSVEDERFTELDHGLQTAALLREHHTDDATLQIAGLVHDLAHPWDVAGQPRHATMGAEAVLELYGPRVSNLIAAHVPAKRYLVATIPEYFEVLSPDSVMTLEAQGGPMDDVEVREFEADPDCTAMVALRVADDSAKVPGAVVPGLEFWIPTLRGLAIRPHEPA